MGMKAAAKYQFGSESLDGKKILVQGIGHVGETLVDFLKKEGAQVQITDINQGRLEEVSQKYGASIFTGADIYSADVDIYSPCALGATINDETINKLKARVIAGAANNQLANDAIHGQILKGKGILYAPCALGATVNDDTINKIQAKVIAGAANNQLANEQIHGQILKDRGILYAPDFLINAGGIINVYAEIVGYDSAEAMRRTENIYNTTLEIFAYAEQNGITTQEAAMRIAQNRIDTRKKENATK